MNGFEEISQAAVRVGEEELSYQKMRDKSAR